MLPQYVSEIRLFLNVNVSWRQENNFIGKVVSLWWTSANWWESLQESIYSLNRKGKIFPSLIHAVIWALRIIDVISYFCEHI
jgi:hypothetical protein